jgi:magnesium chelatase subunit I
MQKQIKTLGELKKSGWKPKTVKEEIRQNLIQKMKTGENLFPGIIGYEKTVVPQLQHALLARHDLILLGLRGQAKTKILRMMVQFLDEYIPVVEGSEINDDPLRPVSKYARELIEEKGDQTPVAWLHREFRYGEKLATPDTTVADLIGDIDPIKAASQKLTLADENVINYGLVPRTNRGIFVINELPDLQPRIQVALLNIMQERDIQIRGFNIRIPLDLFMAFSANPEDYTNRGNIITPLKDRIDTQIITHYPKDIAAGMAITKQEADFNRNGSMELDIHPLYREIIEQVAFDARESEYVDQKSGVSTRMTITAMEQVYSSAERRALTLGEKSAIIRISDLFHMVPALTGKMELVYEGEQEGAINVAKHIIGKAVNNVFRRSFPDPQRKKDEENPYTEIINWFKKGNEVILPDNMNEADYQKSLDQVDGLSQVVDKYIESPGDYKYALMDLVLEALHQNSMLGKEDMDQERSFSDMLGSMLGGMGDFDDDDSEDFDEFRGMN